MWGVRLYLFAIKHNAMKMYMGVDVQIHAFFTTVADEGRW